MRSLTRAGDPERDPYPSVEDPSEQFCPYCEAMPDEDHEPHCPMNDGTVEASDIQFCDACGCSYVTCCGCDAGEDR